MYPSTEHPANVFENEMADALRAGVKNEAVADDVKVRDDEAVDVDVVLLLLRPSLLDMILIPRYPSMVGVM